MKILAAIFLFLLIVFSPVLERGIRSQDPILGPKPQPKGRRYRICSQPGTQESQFQMDSAFAWVFGELWRRYVLCHIMLSNLYLCRFPFPQHSQSIVYRSHANAIKTAANSIVHARASEGVNERACTRVSKSKFASISRL